MKKKIKYGIIFILILLIGIISINLYQPDKEQTLKGKIEIIAYDDSYNYLVECAEKFMDLNDKTTVTVKKIYSPDEILSEIEQNNNKVTYIAQINRTDFDTLGFERFNYLEEQQNILNTYSKNFAPYRLQQTKYDDVSIKFKIKNDGKYIGKKVKLKIIYPQLYNMIFEKVFTINSIV